jgi:3-methyladenine DNA glycosylase AlkD
MADDRDWFIQKAIAWWLRDLSKHDPARTRTFLAAHGDRLKPFARTEAARLLSPED